MNRRLILPLVAVCALLASSLVPALAADSAASASQPSGNASPAGGAPAAASVIGSKQSAKWTETTVKAAGTPEQKAVLGGAKVATITGELVEVSCYLQLGKRGEAHIPCGSDCLRHGQPAGIVDGAGKLTLLFVEEHDPRRYGQIDVREKLVQLLAKQVTATGMLTKMKDGSQALYVGGSDINPAK